MDAWQSFTLRTCEGETIPMLEGEADWPHVTDTSEAAWSTTKEAFQYHARQIQECIANWDDAQAKATVSGRDFPFKVLLHGVAHHNVYHAGQIAILKKAKG